MNAKRIYLCIAILCLFATSNCLSQSTPEEIAQVIMSGSPNKRWGTLFLIRDGSGLYCAIDVTKLKTKADYILEGVPVTNVKGVTIRPRITGQRTVWSPDGEKACLLVQNRPVAILDFKNQRGYTKTPTRKPTRWKQKAFTWDERLLRFFPSRSNGV